MAFRLDCKPLANQSAFYIANFDVNGKQSSKGHLYPEYVLPLFIVMRILESFSHSDINSLTMMKPIVKGKYNKSIIIFCIVFCRLASVLKHFFYLTRLIKKRFHYNCKCIVIFSSSERTMCQTVVSLCLLLRDQGQFFQNESKH